jgi:hypothetical protein
VLSLLNRKPAPQVRSFSAGNTQPLPRAAAPLAARAIPPIPPAAAGQSWQHTPPLEIARRLDAASCRVLVNAVRPAINGAAAPYVPLATDDIRAAQWLTQPELALLMADWAGYAVCYHPTPLGRAVVHALLTDAVLQRLYGTQGAWAAAPAGMRGEQALPAAQPGWNGAHHAR